MLASLLPPTKPRRPYMERSPFSSPDAGRRHVPPFYRDYVQHPYHDDSGLNYDGNIENNGNDHDILDGDHGVEDNGEHDEVEDEDEPHESTPLLPIFSASHLGMATIPANHFPGRLNC